MSTRSPHLARPTRRAAVAAAAVAAGTLVAAGHAPAASAVEVFNKLELAHSGQVLDVRQASTANNAHVSQFPFHGGDNQQWKQVFVSAPSSSTVTGDFLLRNRHSGTCLDVEGQSTAPGAHLVQQPCDLTGGTASQRWFMHKVADKGLLTGKGYRWVFNRKSGLVIDIQGASTNADTLAVLFHQKALTSADNQLIHFAFGGAA